MNTIILPDEKLFVLDTNVLMHDPAAVFRFQEHYIFVPMVVLEEMDNHKKGITEIARNVRQASRFFGDIIKNADPSALEDGIPLSQLQNSGTLAKNCSGRLFFQAPGLNLAPLPEGAIEGLNDNTILKIVLALQEKYPQKKVVLVSKDINVRIKAWGMGIHAEDYQNDQAVEDADMLYSGEEELLPDFWETEGGNVESWKDLGREYYTVSGSLVETWYPNQFLYMPKEGKDFEAIVQTIVGGVATLEVTQNFYTPAHKVWGIMARNREQNYALNVLLDPKIPFVALLGTSGTGKTLMALAAGLAQVMEKKLYTEIIMTRNTISIGEDIGFLPGTEEEKMAPWMGALMDNLELLGQNGSGKTGTSVSDAEYNMSKSIVMNRIKIRSLNFMRGRTFLNRYLIIDEAQNLTAKQMKTLITRAGPGTKVVCIGNLEQIDTPYLTATTSGLTYVVDRFKNWPGSASIIFKKCERSWLADYANEVL